MGDDIEIVDSINDGRYTYVRSIINGDIRRIDKMPKEILSTHAAEYNLEPDDDFVLDLVMLQRYIVLEDSSQHPLWASDSIEEAVEAMKELIEGVRVMNGSPEGENRMLAAAVRNAACSDGLVKAHGLFHRHIDQQVVEPIQFFRDKNRARHKEMRQGKFKRPSLSDSLQADMMKAKERENADLHR